MEGIIRLLSYRNTKKTEDKIEKEVRVLNVNQTGWEKDAGKNEG